MTDLFWKKLNIFEKPFKLSNKYLNAIKYRIYRIQGIFWCKRRETDLKEAIKKITGSNFNISFYEKFQREIAEAERKKNMCPIKMGGEGDLELIYQLCEYIKARKIIETGVAYGWSSLTFLLSIHDREGALLISTDLPYSQETAPYVGYVVPEELHEKWKIIKKPDKEALPEALKIMPEIDMCYYDSDKTYEGRMFAYPLLWEALRKGGIFISDDISDNLAFAKFAKNVNIEPIIVGGGRKYSGVLIKKSN